MDATRRVPPIAAGRATIDSSSARITRDAPVSSLDRPGHLPLLDGVRAYLAIWVLISHAMWLSGFEADALDGVWSIVCRGAHAVDVFVLLSGFVIFKLLDARRESYGVFITRRFLRLYPVYIVLFLAAIPAARLAVGNLVLASHYFTGAQAAHLAAQYRAWFEHLGWHTVLHFSMLHGVVPRAILPEGPGAFLEPAWSVSLEWQFYLVAPLAYALATSARRLHRVAVSLAALLAFALAAAGLVPFVDFGAALPFHAEYFFIGAVSWFFYKRASALPLSNTPTVVFLVTSLFVFQLGRRNPQLIAVCVWMIVLGLLLERDGRWMRLLTTPFCHPVAQFVGRISYSMYLCHMILLYLMQYLLLRFAPSLGRTAHCVWLVMLTFAAALPVSALLFRWIEEPAIRLGRALKQRQQPELALQAAE